MPPKPSEPTSDFVKAWTEKIKREYDDAPIRSTVGLIAIATATVGVLSWAVTIMQIHALYLVMPLILLVGVIVIGRKAKEFPLMRLVSNLVFFGFLLLDYAFFAIKGDPLTLGYWLALIFFAPIGLYLLTGMTKDASAVTRQIEYASIVTKVFEELREERKRTETE